MPLMVLEPLGLYAQLACLWEVTARKPGNVHRFADFEDAKYVDFVASAAAIAQVFERIALPHKRPCGRGAVGGSILAAIRKTRAVTRTNTNLGIAMLLVPLALADKEKSLKCGVQQVLELTGITDAQEVYRAIRLARPGGMGQVSAQDIREEPVGTLREVMALAADRDMIARQYATGFREIFDEGVPSLQRGLKDLGALEEAIIYCHLSLLAKHPDSLIGRKCGKELAEEVSRRAAEVLEVGWPHTANGREMIAQYDAWLRADGHRRNPGTTADMVTASLFVALREGIITLPVDIPWSVER